MLKIFTSLCLNSKGFNYPNGNLFVSGAFYRSLVFQMFILETFEAEEIWLPEYFDQGIDPSSYTYIQPGTQYRSP